MFANPLVYAQHLFLGDIEVTEQVDLPKFEIESGDFYVVILDQEIMQYVVNNEPLENREVYWYTISPIIEWLDTQQYSPYLKLNSEAEVIGWLCSTEGLQYAYTQLYNLYRSDENLLTCLTLIYGSNKANTILFILKNASVLDGSIVHDLLTSAEFTIIENA